jgi:hypothetical protein
MNDNYIFQMEREDKEMDEWWIRERANKKQEAS